jgi:hypothetical protein
VLEDAGLTLLPLGGVADLSRVIDNATERRTQRDFEVSYQVTSTVEAVTEATTIVLTETVEGAASDLVETQTISLD